MSTSGLGSYLIKEGLLTEGDCQLIARDHSNTGAAFAKVIVALGILSEEALAKYLAQKTKFTMIPHQQACVMQAEVKGIIDIPIVESLEVIPISLDGKYLLVAMADPLDQNTLQQLSFFTPYKIKPVIATFSSIYKSLSSLIKGFAPQETTLQRFLSHHKVVVPNVINTKVSPAAVRSVDSSADMSKQDFGAEGDTLAAEDEDELEKTENLAADDDFSDVDMEDLNDADDLSEMEGAGATAPKQGVAESESGNLDGGSLALWDDAGQDIKDSSGTDAKAESSNSSEADFWDDLMGEEGQSEEKTEAADVSKSLDAGTVALWGVEEEGEEQPPEDAGAKDMSTGAADIWDDEEASEPVGETKEEKKATANETLAAGDASLWDEDEPEDASLENDTKQKEAAEGMQGDDDFGLEGMAESGEESSPGERDEFDLEGLEEDTQNETAAEEGSLEGLGENNEAQSLAGEVDFDMGAMETPDTAASEIAAGEEFGLEGFDEGEKDSDTETAAVDKPPTPTGENANLGAEELEDMSSEDARPAAAADEEFGLEGFDEDETDVGAVGETAVAGSAVEQSADGSDLGAVAMEAASPLAAGASVEEDDFGFEGFDEGEENVAEKEPVSAPAESEDLGLDGVEAANIPAAGASVEEDDFGFEGFDEGEADSTGVDAAAAESSDLSLEGMESAASSEVEATAVEEEDLGFEGFDEGGEDLGSGSNEDFGLEGLGADSSEMPSSQATEGKNANEELASESSSQVALAEMEVQETSLTEENDASEMDQLLENLEEEDPIKSAVSEEKDDILPGIKSGPGSNKSTAKVSRQVEVCIGSLNQGIVGVSLSFEATKARQAAQDSLIKAGVSKGFLFSWDEQELCLQSQWSDTEEVSSEMMIEVGPLLPLVPKNVTVDWQQLEQAAIPELQRDEHSIMTYKSRRGSEGFNVVFASWKNIIVADPNVHKLSMKLLDSLAKKLV